MHSARTALLLLVAVVSIAACEGVDSSGEPAASDTAVEAEAGSYQVVLGNAISDTLRGEARFGRVYDPSTRTESFVIRLASAFDFAGGVVMARPDTVLPEPGTYGLQPDSLAYAPPDRFVLIYREGILRELQAASGSLNLTTVTDTLITGSFDARLVGRVGRFERTGGAEVHAVGRFRARPNLDGFVIGL